MKKLRETGNPPTNCELGEKIDEIVDWINYTQAAIHLHSVDVITKPIEKKCENCNFYKKLNCVTDFEKCLTNNYKFFESK